MRPAWEIKALSRCCQQVQTQGTSMHWHQCFSAGTVTREGKLFCKMHDPVAVLARHDKRCAKWDAERAATRARWKKEAAEKARADLCVAACEGLTDTDLKRLAEINRCDIMAFVAKNL